MEYLASTIVIFWIFAGLSWLATLAFIALDKDAKETRWFWFAGAIISAPFILLPYFIWGRERNK